MSKLNNIVVLTLLIKLLRIAFILRDVDRNLLLINLCVNNCIKLRGGRVPGKSQGPPRD